MEPKHNVYVDDPECEGGPCGGTVLYDRRYDEDFGYHGSIETEGSIFMYIGGGFIALILIIILLILIF